MFQIVLTGGAGGTYDLVAEHEELGARFSGVSFRPGPNPPLELKLAHAVSISGTVRGSDNSALTGVVVQLLRAQDGGTEFVPVTCSLTDVAGRYQFVNLAPGD